MHRLQVLFMVTDEMVGSCITYMNALNAAGFEKDSIGIDIDGKRKLVRNNLERAPRYTTRFCSAD